MKSCRTSLENLIQEIQFNGVKDDLKRWIRTGAEYILEGAFYVARFQFPEISMDKINEQIESIRKDVWIEINNNLTALEKVKILNYIIFDLHKFSRTTLIFILRRIPISTRYLKPGREIQYHFPLYIFLLLETGITHLWCESSQEFYPGLQG